jgi:hypothetical protein
MSPVIVATFLFFAVAAPDPCQGGLLPKDLRNVIAKDSPGWRIVSVTDLRVDDKELWEKASGKQCPGIAIGQFHSKTQVSYAILLYRNEAGQMAERLLVARQVRAGRYDIQELWPASQTAVLGVIHKEPPGEYVSWDRNESVRVSTDVIVHEVLEAGATVYYWLADGFHSIHVSD